MNAEKKDAIRTEYKFFLVQKGDMSVVGPSFEISHRLKVVIADILSGRTTLRKNERFLLSISIEIWKKFRENSIPSIQN